MSAYDQDVAAVLEAIASEGGLATIERAGTAGTYDPLAQTTTGGSGKQTWTNVPVLVKTPSGRPDVRFSADAKVRSRQRELLIPGAALPTDPAEDDRITIEGVTLAVLSWSTLRPDGLTAVLHRVVAQL